MDGRDSSPLGSVDECHQDADLDDGYIYDEYDTSPLLPNDELEGATEFTTHRTFDGRMYSLLSPKPRDHVQQINTIVPNRDRRACLCRVFVILFLCGLGFIAGYFTSKKSSRFCTNTVLAEETVRDFHSLAQREISASNLGKFLRYFTEVPHIGGSNISYQQALYIEREWTKYGFEVELKKYDVLLSYPKRPNIASIVSSNGAPIFTAQRREKILEPQENHSDVVPPFNAFSASGNVTGRLIYVNYARVEDFQELRNRSINCTGHIVIAKYGKIFRGDKARIATGEGAIGLILYTDPIDYSPVGPDYTYPKSWWMPPTGIQRGTLLNLEEGDPLTPGYPAREGVFRRSIDKANLPSIPVYPISYSDASRFLSLLNDTKAPNDWQGGLRMDYNIRMAEDDKRNVTLEVEMLLETRSVYNVIGTIKGSLEPDRLVLLGNHRDAWIFGAVDPSSGTAALMEAARSLGELKDRGWKPRRTIVLCSWGAEEPGLIGSTEWAEDYANLLSSRAVAYINVDFAVEGNYSLTVQSSPLLDFAFMEATKKVPHPGSSSSDDTMYEDWKNKFPDDKDPKMPFVRKVGSGSDHTCVYFRLGIPSVYFAHTYNKHKWSVSGYPVYHSVHDSFHWMKNFVDRNFEYHRAITQIWVQFSLHLADSVVLPFDCSRFAERLARYGGDLETSYGQTLAQQNITLGHFKSSITEFTTVAKEFHTFLESVDRNNPLAVRMVNDRLMQLERTFINPQGLPGRPYIRHVIFAPSAHNSYAGSSFPGLVDALYEVQRADEKDWDKVKKELSVVTYFIQAATDVIKLASL